MCGIVFTTNASGITLEQTAAMTRKLVARGPEGERVVEYRGLGNLGFTRLAINGLHESGMQPMAVSGTMWVCNGEIYNWRELAERYGISNPSGSDCGILGPLYRKFCDLGIPLEGFFRALDGVFAIVILDLEKGRWIVGRDPYGVRPLYMGVTAAGGYAFASELKALTGHCSRIDPFKPGTFLESGGGVVRSYHTIPCGLNPLYSAAGGKEGGSAAYEAIRTALTVAVKKRMMTERPCAALLSGGIDSSLIASLVARELRAAGAPPLKTFSIGMEGSTDLKYARKVASWIGSDHTEIVMTAEDFFAAVPAVIQDIESFDTTTVRASVGNWLVAREIARRSDCKVVFNGDGSDEIFGSYLYFFNAPSDEAFDEESVRLLEDIHAFDVLRSDRCISSHGLEPRTPFLDKAFVATVRSVAAAWRRPLKGKRVEKEILRAAFMMSGLLPFDVLRRQKEAFSDGVSGTEKAWYLSAQEKAAVVLGNSWKENVAERWPHMTPSTAEQAYYRSIWDKNYGGSGAEKCIPYFWMPRWCEGATDPSARTLAVYTVEEKTSGEV